MTDFMTALHVIVLPLTHTGDQRTKGAQFQPTCNLCRESHKTQVWLCFLVLSLLSTSTCAQAFVPETADLKICLRDIKKTIEKSDAMLYAPSVNDIKDNCKTMSLKCYILELIMVMDEEEITETTAVDCIFHFNESLQPEVGCPPCESYSLKNITIFLERLNKLLDYITVWQINHKI
ncbi:interleukin-15 isoform X1 [Stegastes partitus]|uniref:Interleukin n=1 Tax=Stegastes partitus TaxID=144197 RepID=A0A3B4Z7R6_9TELE|nr:PREDICTED: interleukin-15-like isoform X1 [Stegastes partitus]